MTRTDLIDEPAAAVAAALCLLARDRDGTTPRHPRRCTWCDWPAAELREMVAGFNELAGYSDKRRDYRLHSARVFNGLPAERQAQLVLAAQELDPEPMAGASAAQSDEQEDIPSWL